MAERVAACAHITSTFCSRDVIHAVTSLVDEPVGCLGDGSAAAIVRALSELDDSDRAALLAAVPALARLAEAIISLPS